LARSFFPTFLDAHFQELCAEALTVCVSRQNPITRHESAMMSSLERLA
jgi:hypothetical protein